MQTKLRIPGLLVVASLLWTSPTSAAIQKVKAQKTSNELKIRYIGTASWYGKKHQGRKMANGKRFDCNKLTAASWYYPLGTMIRVVNLKNDETVVVTITDRGPNMRLHRLVDLSEAAAQDLDYVGPGLTPVFVYPMPSFDTEPAVMNSDLAEPPVVDATQYEAKAFTAPM
jgi:rare lipoprotein A